MYDEFEAGYGLSDYVKVEVAGKDGQKFSLNVNPVGQFNPGGCLAFVSLKKEALLELNSVEELYDYLLNRIYFENLEVAFDMDDYSLKNVLDYTKDLEVDDDNSWYLNYFKRLEKLVSQFKEELLKCNLEDLKVNVHEYHQASGEACDFVDFTCCPEGDEEEELREFFESSLTPESEIDSIMEHFEDGYFYGSSYSADQLTAIDFASKTITKTLTIQDVQ